MSQQLLSTRERRPSGLDIVLPPLLLCALSLCVIFALALYAVCVGASRVVLGVHYPTNVLGGCLLGIAWATLLMALTWVVSHGLAARYFPGR